MSTPYNVLEELTRAFQSSTGSITDPGSGGTIKTLLKGIGICKVRTLTTESRVLDAANNLVAGQMLLVILKTDGGDLTITGASNGSVVLQQEGQAALFYSTEISTGVVSWWAINPQSGVYGYGINVKAAPFNAQGDGSTDDSIALQAAVDAAKLLGTVVIAPEGTYKISSDVTMRHVEADFSLASILVSGTTTKLVIGGNANVAFNPRQRFYSILRSGGVNSNPTCRIMGAKGQTIDLVTCDYLDLYADTSTGNTGTDYSIAYNTFNFGKINKMVLTNNSAAPGNGFSATQWINENTFNLKRCGTLIVEGTYSHNHNLFYGGGWENDPTISATPTITFTTGNNNVLYSPRFEGGTQVVSFAAGTNSNKIICTWDSDQIVGQTATLPFTYTDAGEGNVVTRLSWMVQQRIPILVVNDRTCQCFSNTAGGSTTARAGNYTSIRGLDLQRYGADTFHRSNSTLIYDSPLIPVSLGDLIHFAADASGFRIWMTVYNSSRVLISPTDVTDAATYMRTKSGLTYDGTNTWKSSSNITDNYAQVKSSTVAFVKFNILAGSAALNVPFRQLALHKVTSNVNPLRFPDNIWQTQQRPATTASPTVGYAYEPGTKVSKIGGGWFTATTALDTTLSVTGAGTGTSVTLTSVTGVASGDVIGIVLDSGATHFTTVSGALTGSSVPLTVALPSAATSGNRVTTNAWAAT